jgi:hypothetical protein
MRAPAFRLGDLPAPAPRFRLTPEIALEQDIHECCAAALDRLLMPPALWFCYPAGAVQLSAPQWARYSRMGLKRGLPDLWFLYRGVYCVELKREGGRLSRTRIARTRRGSPRVLVGQEDVFPALLASGAVLDIAIAHNVDEMLDRLDAWGIPLRRHRR